MFGYMVHNRHEHMFDHSVRCMIMHRTSVCSETEHVPIPEMAPQQRRALFAVSRAGDFLRFLDSPLVFSLQFF